MSEKHGTVFNNKKKYSLFNSMKVGGDFFIDWDIFAVYKLGI